MVWYAFFMMNTEPTVNPNSNLNPQEATAPLAHVSSEEVYHDEGHGHMYPDDGDYDPSSDY